MVEHAQPGPYTLLNLGRAMATHAPAVLRGIPQAVAGFRGDEGLRPHTRIAIQLRLARLLGCPVCRALFPAIGRKAGLTEAFMRAALDGEAAGLTPEAVSALAWVDEVVRSGGSPGAPVGPATELTVVQRDHLRVMTRLDIIIHSIGLMFLPHSLVTRAWAD